MFRLSARITAGAETNERTGQYKCLIRQKDNDIISVSGVRPPGRVRRKTIPASLKRLYGRPKPRIVFEAKPFKQFPR